MQTKKNRTTLLLMLLALCLIIAGCRANGLTIGGVSLGGYTYAHADRYTPGGASVSGRITHLDVSWIAGKVTIATHSGSAVQLSESASRGLKQSEELHWWLDGSTLYVKYAGSGLQGIHSASKQLTVLLPANLQLDKAVISAVSADVKAEALAADTVTVSTVSGRADLDLRHARSIKADTVSGDMRISADAPEEMNIDSVSGDVRIFLPEGTGFTARMDSVSGDLTGSLLTTREGRNHYTHGSGRCKLNVDTVSGDVEVNRLGW